VLDAAVKAKQSLSQWAQESLMHKGRKREDQSKETGSGQTETSQED